MAEVIFLAGLPASGKSTYAKTLEKDGYLVFSSDDYKEKAGIKNNNIIFRNLVRQIVSAERRKETGKGNRSMGLRMKRSIGFLRPMNRRKDAKVSRRSVCIGIEKRDKNVYYGSYKVF